MEMNIRTYKAGEKTTVDGGLSTQLEKHVGQVDGHPLWTARFLASNPEAVYQTHLDFLRGGAQIISTCTYQATIYGFHKHMNIDLEGSLNLLKRAVDLAHRAVATFMQENPNASRPLIAGSVGPYGAAQSDGSEYTGNYLSKVSKEELSEWHLPKIEALLSAKVDLLAFETVPGRLEAEVLLDLLQKFPDARAWLSFSCKDEKSIANGDPFAETARACWKRGGKQLIAVGINCLSPKWVTPLLSDVNIEGEERIPLIANPNSGEKYDERVGWTEGEKIPPLEDFVDEWLSIGADFVGSCCRTSAEDTSKIRKKVDAWNARL